MGRAVGIRAFDRDMVRTSLGAWLTTRGVMWLVIAVTLVTIRMDRGLPAGALAAATRNTGAILALAVLLDALAQWRASADRNGLAVHRKPWSRYAGFIAAATIPLGLVVYMAYLSRAFGDPLAFLHAEAAWGKHVTVAGMAHIIPAHPGVPWLIDALVALAMIPLVIGVARLEPAALGAYTLPTFLLLFCTGAGLEGMTRYTLMLVPAYVLLGALARRVWLHRLVLVGSLPLMLYVSVLFSHWSGPV